MNRHTICALGLLSCMLLVLPAYAGPPRGPELFRNLQDELGLSEGQMQEIEELHYESRLQEIEKRADLARAELDLDKALAETNPNESQVFQKFERVCTTRAALERIHLEKRLGIRKILSEDQQDKLRRLLMERRPPHREHRRGRD